MRINGGRLPIIYSLFLLLLLSASASAKETWTRVETKNFVLVGNGSDRDLRKVAMRLEEFRKAITLLLPRASVNAAVPTTVVVFKSDSSFDPFKPRYKGKAKDNIAGYFLRGPESNYIALTTETGGTVSPYHVIFHEFVHFLIGNNLAHAPVWLNEGLAEFYSTFETADDDQKVIIGRPIVWHLAALQQMRPLPLKTFLAVDRKSPHYNESSKAGVFYAQSWALTHYLMLGNGGKRQEQLARFIDRLRFMSPEENFKASFGVTYDQMETELYNYLRKTSYPMIEFKLREQLDFDKEAQSATLSEAEVKYYQGELYTRLRQFDQAESYLQKAIELDGKLAAPKVSLGILRYYQARRAEAKVFLERAIENDPQNYLAHNYYALVSAAEGKTDDAIKAFTTAIQLNPKAVKIYIQLAALYARLGRYDEAMDAYNRATKVDFYEPQAYRGRAYLFLQQGKGGFAVANARSVLNLNGWKDTRAPYMALVVYLGQRQAQQNSNAGKTVEEALAHLDAGEWPYPVFKYLHKQITAQQLLDLATDNDKQTEAHAYVGLDLSLSGRREEALEHLRWVRDKGNKNFVEYPLALAELARLGEPEKSPAAEKSPGDE